MLLYYILYDQGSIISLAVNTSVMLLYYILYNSLAGKYTHLPHFWYQNLSHHCDGGICSYTIGF